MVYDLIDYHLRECIKREVKMRVCKNCGRYFALTGRTNTEYCSQPFDEKGRTCREVGAIALWTKRKSRDALFIKTEGASNSIIRMMEAMCRKP